MSLTTATSLLCQNNRTFPSYLTETVPTDSVTLLPIPHAQNAVTAPVLSFPTVRLFPPPPTALRPILESRVYPDLVTICQHPPVMVVGLFRGGRHGGVRASSLCTGVRRSTWAIVAAGQLRGSDLFPFTHIAFYPTPTFTPSGD
jgi:hypothetical protein